MTKREERMTHYQRHKVEILVAWKLGVTMREARAAIINGSADQIVIAILDRQQRREKTK